MSRPKKEHWWITELKEKEADKALKWFEEQNRIAEFKRKEAIIESAFIKEIDKKREEIEKINKEIQKLKELCNQCLAKISVGDTGVMDLLAENNTLK